MTAGTGPAPNRWLDYGSATPHGYGGRFARWYGGKPLPLCNEFQGASLTPPTFVKGKFRDMVRDHDQLYLRVASSVPVGSGELTVVTSEAFDQDLVGKIAATLGEISLYTNIVTVNDAAPKPGPNKASSAPTITFTNPAAKKQGGLTVTSSDGADKTKQVAKPDFVVGKIPEATGTFDREITFGTPLKVVDWDSGQSMEVGRTQRSHASGRALLASVSRRWENSSKA